MIKYSIKFAFILSENRRLSLFSKIKLEFFFGRIKRKYEQSRPVRTDRWFEVKRKHRVLSLITRYAEIN